MTRMSLALLATVAFAAVTWRALEKSEIQGKMDRSEAPSRVAPITAGADGAHRGDRIGNTAWPSVIVVQHSEPPAVTPSAAPPETRPAAPAPSGPPSEDAKRGLIRFFAAAADQLDVHLISEDVDPGWAHGARADAERAFGRVMSRDATLRSVDCRTDICRLETELPSYADYREFAERALDRQTRPWNGGVAVGPVEEKPDGRLVARLYIAREGYSLASPGPAGP